MKRLKLILFLTIALPSLLPLYAQKDELQAQMYELFTKEDISAFIQVTDSLKHLCEHEGDEQTFYKAWGNQAIYLSRHQRRHEGLETVRAMRDYASEHDSKFGEYTSVHVMASIYYTMQNYKEAEENLLKSIELLHANFPGESAAASFLELVNIANRRNDFDNAYYYAISAMEEPNVVAQHKLRALSRLCQLDAHFNDVESFNRHYAQRQEVRQTTTADGIEKEIETEWHLLNGRYEEALAATEGMPISRVYFMKASISHRMGRDAEAYANLLRDKQINDSISAISQNDIVSEYIMQLTDERLEVERMQLQADADRQLALYRWMAIGAVLCLLVYIIWGRMKTISQLKHSNAELDQARQAEHSAREEAEKALDVKREFINNISHELRTPLNPITGFSDILATPGFELSAEERSALSQHIKDSSHTLTGIIDHMIELSYYESKASLQLDDIVHPNMVCQSIVDEMKMHNQPGVTLQFRPDLLDMIHVRTDLQSVQKVLRQLVENAQKHTTEGSIRIRTYATDGAICFSVTDTGEGIPPALRPHLFEPFNQTDDNVKVTGMGLAICHRIAELLGGRVYYDDDYRTGGARFIFEIPNNRPANGQSAKSLKPDRKDAVGG